MALNMPKPESDALLRISEDGKAICLDFATTPDAQQCTELLENLKLQPSIEWIEDLLCNGYYIRINGNYDTHKILKAIASCLEDDYGLSVDTGDAKDNTENQSYCSFAAAYRVTRDNAGVSLRAICTAGITRIFKPADQLGIDKL